MLLRAEHPVDRGDVRQAVAQQHRGAHHTVSRHLVRANVVIIGSYQESYQHLEALLLHLILN